MGCPSKVSFMSACLTCKSGITVGLVSQETATIPGPPSPGSDAEILLKWDDFALAARVLKAVSPAEIGDLVGVHERTIKRAQKTGVAGGKLVGNALRVFGQRRRKLASVGLKPTFETFFEVQ